MTVLPFRWNLVHRNHLGRLVEGGPEPLLESFPEMLIRCCARVVAFAGDSDLVFVGRSPESIFDSLSGLLFDTSWRERPELLHFSMRYWEESEIREQHPGALGSMRLYLEHLGLDPESIATRERPIALIDLVATGDTFGRLVRLLHGWTREIGFDWNAVRRRIRIVGITWSKKTSPKTWRWQQHAEWVSLLESNAVKNVSIPWALWDYLGNYQPKVTLSYSPPRWGDPALASPGYSEEQLRGLRLAYHLFEDGRTAARRRELARLLSAEKAMEQEWLRSLVLELRS